MTNSELTTIIPATTEDISNKYNIMTKEEANTIVTRPQDVYKKWEEDLDKQCDSLYDVSKELRITKKIFLDSYKWNG